MTDSSQNYKPGDIANGHVLTQDLRWVPVGPPVQPPAGQQVTFLEPPVREPKNGLAIVSLIIAMCGLLLSFIPLTGWLAIMAGFAATVLGLVAWKRKRDGRATAGKTAIVGTVSGVLAMVLGVIGMVTFFNIVGDLEEMTADTEPVAVAYGEAFNHDGYKAEAGWTIKADAGGDPTIEGLTVTNANHKSGNSTSDTPMFTFRLYKGTQNMAEVSCTGNEVAKGESTAMDCYSFDSGEWAGYDTVKIDDRF